MHRIATSLLTSAAVVLSLAAGSTTATAGESGRFMQRYDLTQDIYRITVNADQPL